MVELSKDQEKNLNELTEKQKAIVLRILKEYPETLEDGIIFYFLEGEFKKGLFLSDLPYFKKILT